MIRNVRFSVWFSLVLVSAFTVGFLSWTKATFNWPYDQTFYPYPEKHRQISNSTSTPSGVEGWKTYRNEEFGFEVKYPENWFTYDTYNSPCGDQYGDMVLFRKTKLTDCNVVDLVPANLWIYVESKLRSLPKSDEFDTYNPYELAGVSGVVNYKTEKSEGPRVKDTKIYVNMTGKSYVIAHENTDYKGGHEIIFDQILSTFKFIK